MKHDPVSALPPTSIQGVYPLYLVMCNPSYHCCGVYFLCLRDTVVYVGQSISILSRIVEHRRKKYDRAFYTPCREDRLDQTELFFIKTLRPKYNRMYLGRRKESQTDRMWRRKRLEKEEKKRSLRMMKEVGEELAKGKEDE